MHPAHLAILTPGLSSIRSNQHVECHIVMYKDMLVLHLICCASDNMYYLTMLTAIARSWIQMCGAMELLIVDGEGGMILRKRRCVTVDIRASGQHARSIEQ